MQWPAAGRRSGSRELSAHATPGNHALAASAAPAAVVVDLDPRGPSATVGRVLTRLLFGGDQRQKLSRRDGASHLSLLVQRNLAQRNTPRLRARRCAPGPRSRRDFSKGHPAPAKNAAHPCAAPCGSCPPAPPLRRGPESQGQQQRQQLRRSGGSREHVATRASVRRPDLRRNVFPVTGERLNQAAPRGGVGLNELSDLALAPQEVNDAATRAELLVVELGIATLAA